MSAVGLTTSTFGGSRDAGVHPCYPTEFKVPPALPRIRSKHKNIFYRKALRIECAAGDASTVWLPKLRTIEAKLPQLDLLFDDARPRLPKARHPWNKGTSAGSSHVNNISMVPPSDTTSTVAPMNSAAGGRTWRVDPPMPDHLMPPSDTTPAVAPMRPRSSSVAAGRTWDGVTNFDPLLPPQ